MRIEEHTGGAEVEKGKVYPCHYEDCRSYWEEELEEIQQGKEPVGISMCVKCEHFQIKPDLYVKKEG